MFYEGHTLLLNLMSRPNSVDSKLNSREVVTNGSFNNSSAVGLNAGSIVKHRFIKFSASLLTKWAISLGIGGLSFLSLPYKLH